MDDDFNYSPLTVNYPWFSSIKVPDFNRLLEFGRLLELGLGLFPLPTFGLAKPQTQAEWFKQWFSDRFNLQATDFHNSLQSITSPEKKEFDPTKYGMTDYALQFSDMALPAFDRSKLQVGIALQGSDDPNASLMGKLNLMDLNYSKQQDSEVDETDIPLTAKDVNTNNAYTSLGQYGDAAIKAGRTLGQTIGGKYGNAVSDLAKGTLTTINAAKNLKALSSLEKGTAGLKNAKTSNIAAIAGAASDVASNFLAEKTEYSGEQGELTQTLDNVYDGISDALMSIPGWGMLAGGIMKGGKLLGQGLNNLGGGTDAMTTTDAILGSSFLNLTPFGLINGFGGKTTDTIAKDEEAFALVGASYSGSNLKIDDALLKSGKKYGLFSMGAFDQALRDIAEGNRQQSIITNIADTARDKFNIRNSMSAINGNRRAFALQGGYDQSAVRVGKLGLKLIKSVKGITSILKYQNKLLKDILNELDLSNVPEEYLEPNIIEEITLNNIPEQFKEGGTLNLITEIEVSSFIDEVSLEDIVNTLEKFQEGGELKLKEVSPIEYALERFPILGTLEPINLLYDPNFNPKEIGNFGDIEYMNAEYDTLPYYNDYTKNDDFKGKSTIVYNDNVSNEDIALDWLSHGLREHDPKWRKYLELLSKDPVWKEKILDELFGLFMLDKGISPEKYSRMSRKQRDALNKEFDEKEVDLEQFDSTLDGLIRGILVKDDYRTTYAPSEEYEELKNTFIWQLANEYLNSQNNSQLFREGGKFNVIPEGALHARLHHMENADNLTKKGIPVVAETEGGELEQLAEIERNEVILRLEVTKKLEELKKVYDNSEFSLKERDEAAIEAGKLLTYELLQNTIDNTGLLNEIN